MNFSRLVDKVCRPNPEAFKDSIEFEMTFKRNRNLLFLQAVGFFVNIMQAAPIQKLGLAGNILTVVLFTCFCRSYPNLFKIIFFALITISGPLIVVYDKDCIFAVALGILLFPIFILYIIGSKACICQFMIQIIILHFFYKPQLLNSLQTLNHEACLARITKQIALTMLGNCCIVIMTKHSLSKAYENIAVERSKKIDLERRQTFLLSFSHEIRNLINTMMGAVQLSLLESLPTRVRDMLHNSEVCGELLLHLINNVLDTGKAEIGELEINPTPNKVYDTLEKVWSICSQLIRTKRLFGKIRIQKQLPSTLKIDNYRLMQILMNLISNSIKFTQNGSITVDVQWIDKFVSVNKTCFEPRPFDDIDEGQFEKAQATSILNQDIIVLDLEQKKINSKNNLPTNRISSKGILKIIVSDTGCGIPTEKIPELFNKFSQVNADPSKRKMGTGLGLFITKELITKMGGDIQTFSKPNKGTVFIACIPAESVQENVTSQMSMDTFLRLMKRRGMRTLVVDDSETNRTLFCNYFSTLGVQETKIAINGQEAVDKYIQSHQNGKSFDLVTMDVNMPVMDGKKAAELIRDYERQNNLRPCFLIMISGNCSESEIVACMGPQKNGTPTKADYFLKKPASIHQLFSILALQFENRKWN